MNVAYFITFFHYSFHIAGGMPSLPPGLPSAYYQGFEGCIHYITINIKPLNILKHSDSNNIQFCHDNEI